VNNGDSLKFYGIYRGVVMKNKDPEGHRRIQVKIPQLGGGETITQDWPWAWPLFVAGQRPYIPEVGEGVWIQFESGDPAYPIWIGSYGKNQKNNRHIDIEPMSKTETDIEWAYDLLDINRRPDGTEEVDLTQTVLNIVRNRRGLCAYSTSSLSASANTPIAVPYDTVVQTNGVTLASNSRITFPHTGHYNIQFSVQILSSNASNQTVDLWLRKNGTNEPWTNTKITTTGNGVYTVGAWNFLIHVTVPNTYYELMYQTPSTAVTITAASASGNVPGTPGAILTVWKIC
jgi:hypothetical protein